MAIMQTKAAKYMQQHGDKLTSQEVISLMMAGALERIEQAKASIERDDKTERDALIHKLVGIVDGLRGLLNLEAGGELANNLDVLYGYIVERIAPRNVLNMTPENSDTNEALCEVEKLIEEVKTGWDEMCTLPEAMAS